MCNLLYATRCNFCAMIADFPTCWKIFMMRTFCSHEYLLSRWRACNYCTKLQRVACNKSHIKPQHFFILYLFFIFRFCYLMVNKVDHNNTQHVIQCNVQISTKVRITLAAFSLLIMLACKKLYILATRPAIRQAMDWRLGNVVVIAFQWLHAMT